MRLWAHVHTTYSYDGLCSLSHVADLARQRRIDAVLLAEHSDHFTPDAYAELVTKCNAHNQQGAAPLLIPGIEVTADDGAHVLCFGLPDWIEPLRPQPDIIADARAGGAFVALAHPSRADLAVAAERALPFHAIEVWNVKRCRFKAQWHHCRFIRARSREDHAWSAFVGLDAHEAADFQPAYLILDDTPPDPAAILNSLRQGRYQCTYRGITITPDGRYTIPFTQRLAAPACLAIRRIIKWCAAPLRRLAPNTFQRAKRKLRKYM